MKLLASHNSMTYLPFSSKILTPFRSFAQCQNNNIYCQYQSGVRIFDIRVRMSGENPIMCHGFADLKGNVFWNAFDCLQSLQKRKNEDIYVQLVNEDTFHHSSRSDFMKFATFVMNRFNFKFCIVSSKKLWKIEIDEFPAEDSHPCFWSSQNGLIPRPHQFSVENNPENLKRYQEAQNGIWWFDFV